MNEIFTKFLFNKNILIGEENVDPKDSLNTLISLKGLFGVEVTEGKELAHQSIIKNCENFIGYNVPEAFYKGFPDSIKELTKEELYLDQLIHYCTTYGFGDFSKPGHSLFEKEFEKIEFNEGFEIKQFKIVTKEKAKEILKESMENLLASTRPLNEYNFEVLSNFIKAYNYKIEYCASYDTLAKLILNTGDITYLKNVSISNILKLVEYINYFNYHKTNLNKLNLNNQDRKLITRILDYAFENCFIDTTTALEKRKAWCGLLHHIHYKAKNGRAKKFIEEMRGGENKSVYSTFESLMKKDVVEASKFLANEKGSTALIRSLNYILTRCTKEEISEVIKLLKPKNAIAIIQLLLSYQNYNNSKNRTFKFVKFNKLKKHEEKISPTDNKVYLSNETIDIVKTALLDLLSTLLKGKLNKVYIDEDMKRIALPIQESKSMTGYGTLPTGSKIHIEDGKIVRAFTYWEKVNDIDLSAILTNGEKSQIEYSWRTMYTLNQTNYVCHSGDQTSGFNGGSEYIDIDLENIKKAHRNYRYLIFCNNVYSSTSFKECVCRAGYMLRSKIKSGEKFEPKTVKTSFTINCDSRFAYLFALDIDSRDIIWLNIARDSNKNIAGTTLLDFLTSYFNITDTINMYSFYQMLASEIVDDPNKADVVISDKELTLNDGIEQIRSCDIDKTLLYLNTSI